MGHGSMLGEMSPVSAHGQRGHLSERHVLVKAHASLCRTE